MLNANKSHNVKAIVVDTLVLTFLLISFTAQLPVTIALSYMVGVFILLFKSARFSFRDKNFNILVFVILLFIPSVLTFNHGVTPLFYLILSPFLFYLAIDFSDNSINHIRKVIGNVYYIFVFGVSVGLILNWSDPEPLGAILPWASTNGIPSYLIVVQIAYSIAYYLEKNRMPLFTTLVTLSIAVVGLGRGSMITSALILIFSGYINLFIIKSKSDRTIFFRAVLISIVPLFVKLSGELENISNEIELSIEKSKFSAGVLDEHRGRIVSDYLDKIDGSGLILGMDYDGTSINDYYGGNPHNSFIRVHSFYGVIGLIFLLIPLFLVLIARRDLTQKLIVLSLILLSLLRATTEPIFFPSTLDFFYFLYFILFFRFSKITKAYSINA